jgi:hypothetical protein
MKGFEDDIVAEQRSLMAGKTMKGLAFFVDSHFSRAYPEAAIQERAWVVKSSLKEKV